MQGSYSITFYLKIQQNSHKQPHTQLAKLHRIYRVQLCSYKLHSKQVDCSLKITASVVGMHISPSLLLPCTHIPRDVCFPAHISLMHYTDVLQVIVICFPRYLVSPPLLYRFSYNVDDQLLGQLFNGFHLITKDHQLLHNLTILLYTPSALC